MNSHKFWRPFETPMETCAEPSECPSSRRGSFDEQLPLYRRDSIDSHVSSRRESLDLQFPIYRRDSIDSQLSSRRESFDGQLPAYRRDSIDGQLPAYRRDSINGELPNSQSTQYTFDLNHQNSKPIAYLSANSGQLVISSTIRQHFCGNFLVNANENKHPFLSSLLSSPPKHTDRYVPIQPKPENFENKINSPKDKNPFKCEYSGCGKSFRFRSALHNHLLVHSDERKFCCTHCGKRYKQLSGLYSHESVKHLGKGKKFLCDSCGESFVDYRNLRIHEYNQHESDDFAKFVTKALEKPMKSMSMDFSSDLHSDHHSDHHSDDSNHSH